MSEGFGVCLRRLSVLSSRITLIAATLWISVDATQAQAVFVNDISSLTLPTYQNRQTDPKKLVKLNTQSVRIPLPPVRPWGANDAPDPLSEGKATIPQSAKDLTVALEPLPERPNPLEEESITDETSDRLRTSTDRSSHGDGDTESSLWLKAPEEVHAESRQDCRAILIVHMGTEFLDREEKFRVARGTIRSVEDARTLTSFIRGLSITVRNFDWWAGLGALASGNVDAVIVRFGKEGWQFETDKWLGFYQLLSLRLIDETGGFCPEENQ